MAPLVDMDVEFEFYATIRDAVDEKRLVREVEADATVGSALRALVADYDALDGLVFDSEGQLRTHLNVLRNDEGVRGLGGPEAPLSPGDTVVVLPGVAGGAA